jgi:hypothetical protein
MLAPELRQPQRVSDLVLDRRRKGEKILLCRANPIERLFARRERMEISQNGDVRNGKNYVLVLFLS